MDERAHWDAWASDGEGLHCNRPSPSSTPEEAMEALLEMVRWRYGEQAWSSWQFWVVEYAAEPREPRRVNFKVDDQGAFVRAQ